MESQERPPKRQRANFRLPPETLQHLRAMAAWLGISQADVVVMALNDAWRKHQHSMGRSNPYDTANAP